uniref:Uncharacterized protein n=1 Tax=Rhizophora mucronata TaxID=61149 RepID=A0A2P2N3E1_RHIMU
MAMQVIPLSSRKTTGGLAEGIAPFLQLPHFSGSVVKKIGCKKARTFEDFFHMSMQERAELLEKVAGFFSAEIQYVGMVLEMMPSVTLEVKCETEDEEGIKTG